MTSLSNAYNEDNNDPTNGPGRNKSGFLVMGLGVFLVFIGVLLGTTPILQALFDSSIGRSQLLSGLFGGSGTLAIVTGMLYSVPDKSELESKVGLGGIVLCTFGLLWFGIHFPNNWNIYKLHTIGLVGFSYSIGLLTLLGITFHAVVNHRMKSTEKFTITHRFESNERSTRQHNTERQNNQQNDTQGGGVGVIGNLSSDARKTYGARKPMTKQDREKHSLGSNSNDRDD